MTPLDSSNDLPDNPVTPRRSQRASAATPHQPPRRSPRLKNSSGVSTPVRSEPGLKKRTLDLDADSSPCKSRKTMTEGKYPQFSNLHKRSGDDAYVRVSSDNVSLTPQFYLYFLISFQRQINSFIL